MRMIFAAFLLTALSSPLRAQQVEVPVTRIYEDAAISREFSKSPLLKNFAEVHRRDSIVIEFTSVGDRGLKWARYTTAGLNGNSGFSDGGTYNHHEVFRLQPIGAEAEDEWEEYLYVITAKSDTNTGAAIIRFRCKFAFPETVDARVPELLALEVLSDRTVIK